jgi:hypothetical protein
MFDRGESHDAYIQSMTVQGIYGKDYSGTPLGSKGDPINFSTSGMGRELWH